MTSYLVTMRHTEDVEVVIEAETREAAEALAEIYLSEKTGDVVDEFHEVLSVEPVDAPWEADDGEIF